MPSRLNVAYPAEEVLPLEDNCIHEHKDLFRMLLPAAGHTRGQQLFA